MSKDERYDTVIIGAGPNGMTTAAYLAKCGLSVCVLEERTGRLPDVPREGSRRAQQAGPHRARL